MYKKIGDKLIMKNVYSIIIALLPLITSLFATSEVIWGGARSSFYGALPFPEDSSWTVICKNVQHNTGASKPVNVWIVGHIDENGNCVLEFEQPDFVTTVPENVVFLKDINGGTTGHRINNHTETLTHFDKQGVSVFLQVEPGLADISTLMDIVIKQYGHHSSVIGFGIDIEWYKVATDDYANGTIEGKDTLDWFDVTDSAAQHWEDTLLTYNPKYQLFLKHWLHGILSPNYRGNIMFINDSQDFNWGENPEWGDGALNEMVKEFVLWSKFFSEAPVGFQIGYPKDTPWWKKISNPVKTISDEIVEGMNAAGLSQEVGMFWVDFTLRDTTVSFLWEDHGYVSIQNTFNQKKGLHNSIMKHISGTFHFSEPIASLAIYSVNGRVIASKRGIFSSEMSTSFLAPGSYLVEAESYSGLSEVSRIVVH